jgi:hypothetical protein
MRPQRRQIDLLVLASVLIVASLVTWAVWHRSEKQPAAEGPVTGLTERPTDPQFVPAWQFVNFVDGQQPAPLFASHVTVVINGKTRVVTSDQAVQRSTWQGSSLDLYTIAKGYTLREGGQATPPTLTMYVDSGHDFVCGGRDLPSRLPSSPSLWLGLVPAGPGVPASCTFLNVFVSHGTIDALVARTSRRL